MLHVFLPALAFALVVTADVNRNFIAVPIAAGVVVLVCTGTVFAVYRLIPWARKIPGPAFGVMALAASYGNVTYLGLPIITEMLGTELGYVAVLYDLVASTPLLLTLGAFISARYGSGKVMSPAESLKRVIMLPPLWAVVAGIVVRLGGVEMPKLVLDTAGIMGKPVIPIMMFTVGLALDFRDVKRLPMAVPALAIKLILAPILAWWVGSRLGVTGKVLEAITIEGATPVMVLSLVIADEFELDVPLAAACIAVSTVALFFTMPIMMKMLF